MKKKKGEYGYRNTRRRIQLLEILFGAAMIAAQLLARNLTDSQAVKNVLTLMAILSVLPTANVAAPFLAAARYATPPEEFHRRAEEFAGKGILLYDLVVTTKEQILPLDAVLVHSCGIFAYCSRPDTDEKKAEKAVGELLRTGNVKESIRIIKEERTFFSRLETVKPISDEERDALGDAAETMKSLSM